MIQSLNPNIANDRIEMPYPHVEVLTPSNAVALVVPSLTTGDLPVICKYDGTTRRIGSIARSALVLSSLRKVTRLRKKLERRCLRNLKQKKKQKKLMSMRRRLSGNCSILRLQRYHRGTRWK